jgi:hypothetical protein
MAVARMGPRFSSITEISNLVEKNECQLEIMQ